MLCKKCNKRKVCKHYEYLRNTIELNITINNCDEYSTSVMELATMTAPLKTFDNETYLEPEPRFKDVTVDYSKLSQEANNDRVTDDFKVTAVPSELVECKNENCKAKTYAEDLMECSKCGAPVCSSCSYVDMKMPESDAHSINTTVLCEKCFNKEQEIISTPIEPKEIEPVGESFEDVINSMKEEIANAPEVKPAKRLRARKKKETVIEGV